VKLIEEVKWRQGFKKPSLDVKSASRHSTSMCARRSGGFSSRAPDNRSSALIRTTVGRPPARAHDSIHRPLQF